MLRRSVHASTETTTSSPSYLFFFPLITRTHVQCINANPAWAKAYARKGAALHGLRKWDDAIAAYEQGIKIEDSQALRKGLEEVKEAKETASMSGADKGLGKIFSDPNMISKIANNPKTAKYLADPAFMNTVSLSSLAHNPISAWPQAMRDGSLSSGAVCWRS